MTTTLAGAFRSGSGRQTQWRGQTVHSVLSIPVVEGDTIEVQRIGSSQVRAQALKLGLDRGDLRANGLLVPTVAIWSHTAPEIVTLQVVGRRARSVDIWNAWSSGGVDSSWLGNAAMTVDHDGAKVPDRWVIRCSDGLDEASFDDLIVELRVIRSA